MGRRRSRQGSNVSINAPPALPPTHGGRHSTERSRLLLPPQAIRGTGGIEYESLANLRVQSLGSLRWVVREDLRDARDVNPPFPPAVGHGATSSTQSSMHVHGVSNSSSNFGASSGIYSYHHHSHGYYQQQQHQPSSSLLLPELTTPHSNNQRQKGSSRSRSTSTRARGCRLPLPGPLIDTVSWYLDRLDRSSLAETSASMMISLQPWRIKWPTDGERKGRRSSLVTAYWMTTMLLPGEETQDTALGMGMALEGVTKGLDKSQHYSMLQTLPVGSYGDGGGCARMCSCCNSTSRGHFLLLGISVLLLVGVVSFVLYYCYFY